MKNILSKLVESCIIVCDIVGDIMIKLLTFSIITVILIIIGLYYCYKKITNELTKDKILKIFAILTVAIHYSSLWVDYFTTGIAEVENTMLLPIYPCNICMWLLLIVAFTKKKDTFCYKKISEFLAIVGTVCGLVGLFANEIFLANPSFLDYGSLKGLLSHSTMIFGTLFLLTQGYVKIRTINACTSTIFGLILFAVDGAIINTLFSIFNLPEVNAMYMLEFPIDIPGFNFLTLGIVGVIVVFIVSTIYELIFLDPQERWYHNLHKQERTNEYKTE